MSLDILKSSKESIDPDTWYSPREAVEHLDRQVREDTLKGYCREGRVEAKKFGPKNEWRIRGRSLLEIRKQWGLDP